MKRFIGFIIFLSAIVILIITEKKPISKSAIAKSYKHIRSEALNNQLIDVNANRGNVEIVFSDSLRFYIPDSWNYNYDPPSISGWLVRGDSITKKSNNDTIRIHHISRKRSERGGSIKLFVLEKRIR